MSKLNEIWNSLSNARRVLFLASAGSLLFAILLMVRMAAAPDLSLLYADLKDSAAGQIVPILEQRNVAFEVRGGAIYVDSKQRDELRLVLASEGLPGNGSKGYELLDSLSGFGTTAQMFDAAYWRAKEGELARTILSLASVSSARVHIANTSSNPFQRGVVPKASVFLGLNTGSIDQGQARSIRFLVSSAVSEMTPDDVSVIDDRGRLLTAEPLAGQGAAGDQGEAIRERVQRLVEARVGRGNAVVEVSVDTVTESETILERRFDPDGRVAISVDSEETSSQSDNGAAGGVTVASNIPDGDAANGQGESRQNSETRERINYEVSETTREITREPGAIKRLTVAVLVNGTLSLDASGVEEFVPLPVSELEALHDLVASAVGFDETRGDEITIRSLAFEAPVEQGTSAIPTSWRNKMFDLMTLAQIAVLGIVALVLGLFVVRPVLLGKSGDIGNLGNQIALADAAFDPLAPSTALTGEIDEDFQGPGNLVALADPSQGANTEFPIEGPENSEGDAVERLHALIDSRKEETVEILRNWLGTSEEAS